MVRALKNGQVDAIVTDLPTTIYLRDAEVEGSVLVGQFAAPGGDDWGAVHVQEVTAEHGGRRLACVEVLAHQIVDGRIVHTYHRPDQYAVDAFFG